MAAEINSQVRRKISRRSDSNKNNSGNLATK